MDAKEFLKQKGISNNDFMDSGVADLIETLLTEYQALQLQQTGVSRCFSVSEDNFTFSENGFHGDLLSNIMGGIRDLTFYNINDKNKNPLKVVGIQLSRGNNFLACYLENGEQRFIYTHYLAVLK